MDVQNNLRHIVVEILEMAKKDQKARETGQSEIFVPIDQENTARLKEIVAQIGWPTKSKVGEEASAAAWLLVQHADKDIDFQRHCLQQMKSEPENEVSRIDVVYLEDRVRVHEGRMQLYGTQWKEDSEQGFIPYPVENPENLNERRANVGLGSFEKYAEEMRKRNQRLKKLDINS